MKLHFSDLYHMLTILEDLEDKDSRDNKLLFKVRVIVNQMQGVHADKNRKANAAYKGKQK